MSTFEYSSGVGTTLRCRRNSRRFEARVPEKKFRKELFMVDKGFGGRQYQKTTLASNPKRDYVLSVIQTLLINASLTLHILISKNIPVLSWRQELLFSGDNPITWRTTKCTSQCKLTVFEGLKTRPAV